MKHQNGSHLYKTKIDAEAQRQHEMTGKSIEEAYSDAARADRPGWAEHRAWENSVLSGNSRHLADFPHLWRQWELYALGEQLEAFRDDIDTLENAELARHLSAADIQVIEAGIGKSDDTYPALHSEYKSAIEERYPKLSSGEADNIAKMLVKRNHRRAYEQARQRWPDVLER